MGHRHGARPHTSASDGATLSEACASCGLVVAGGTEGCQRLFETIGLREYEDMRLARYHRIVVDVYALQHPGRYGRSAKSFAAHLTGLCAWLENETNSRSVNALVQRWLSGPCRSRSLRCRQATARSRSATSSTRKIPFATARCFGTGRARPGTRMRRCTPPRANGSRPRRVASDRPSGGPFDRPSFGRNRARTVPYLHGAS